MLLPSVSLEELRRRVREAEASLRVAQQYAREAHDDPSKARHASERIQAICRDVERLFPGMHEPSAPDSEVQEILDSLQAETADAHVDEATQDAENAGHEDDENDAQNVGDGEGEYEEGEETDDEEDGEEWDIDYVKLAAALENEDLMSRFPEPARATFTRAARYLIEANERRELFQRVVRGLEEVSALAQRNVDETRRKLELALTLEQLAAKRRD